jgi:hypothetical protein
MASYLASVGYGLAVRAVDGASREDLNRIVDLALAFWPDEPANSPGSGKTRTRDSSSRGGRRTG